MHSVLHEYEVVYEIVGMWAKLYLKLLLGGTRSKQVMITSELLTFSFLQGVRRP